MPSHSILLFILLLPLVSFVLLGLFGRKFFGKYSGWFATGLLLATTALSGYVAYAYFFEFGKINGVFQKIVAFQWSWLSFTDKLSINMGILLDPISMMMVVVVSFVSLMVHLYSISYLRGEDRYPTYFSFLGLFSFSMLGLVLATNIFETYIFWELVGISSYLLIGFYFDRPAAVSASKKAFIVTRFADLGFLIGILILSFYSGSLDYDQLIKGLTTPGTEAWNSAMSANFLGASALSWGLSLIFIGGAGKSAMFPLHIWLPDAMEGPTPVSALIHAATMVVAGVYLVARLFPVYSLSAPMVLEAIAWVGVLSALIAALIACTQTDIKRILAYSTMSQIGFMMFALGSAGYIGEDRLGFTASMFQLFTHAMFKALLFLAAGLVIHLAHSNEVSSMGGLRKKLPVTHICFLIGCLSISGIPPFAGFFSKEEILMAASRHSSWIFWIGLLTSGLTAFYMFRMYFLIFWHKGIEPSHSPQQPEKTHGEGGPEVLLPVILLTVGAALTGFIPFGNFVSADGGAFYESLHLQFSLAPIALGLSGIGLAWWLFKKAQGRPESISSSFGRIYRIIYHKFYIDEVYLALTRGVIFNWIGRPAAWIDKHIVDGVVNLTGKTAQVISEKIKGVQSGKVQQYAIYFLAGILILSLIFIYW